jgi:arylsulfatase A-like enzyme
MNKHGRARTASALSAPSLDRRKLLKWLAVGAAALTLGGGCSRRHPASKRKPNIVLIFSDDQGYGDLGSYGGRQFLTPHTDSIARNGVRFTDGYVTGPVCTASRAGLLTGRYQQRFGCEDGPNPLTGLPQEERTLAERLNDMGYATGIVGKWHLGSKKGQRPMDRGFDEFFGFLGGAHFFLPGEHPRKKGTYSKELSRPILRGDEVVHEKEYLTDAFAREAASFIDRHRDEPFFLYLPFNAVHVPLEATEKDLKRYPEIENNDLRTYAAMTASLEDAVGQVLAALRKNGLEKDTLIFYVSDNGGQSIANTTRNGPLRGQKQTLYEGGIRVPYLMQWKGVVPAGAVHNRPVISLDVYATALAAAGGAMSVEPALDGVDLLPYLRGESSAAPHESLYWRYVDRRALRKGDWKLVQEPSSPGAELYHLAEDITESRNLAKEMPGKLREMEQSYQAYDLQMEDLTWVNLHTAARLQKEGKWPLKTKK